MLGRTSLTLLELREVLNHSLHVLNGFELCLRLLVSEELLHQSVNLLCHLSKVLVHHRLVKHVIFTAEYNLLHLL
jgi:hypothetical protein